MAYVSANWGEEPNLQNKSLTITPEANWSGASTEYYEINPDSGYDALKKVNVRTPMLRDYTLMNVSQVETPSTVYNGDTARSNSAKMLRVAPSKTGMSYTNSYLEVPASSVMGNATADDVRKDKTFTSGSGIALTGTMEVPDLTDATATANDILSPKTAYIADGSKATGTIVTRSASSETISEAKTYSKGYYPNDWTVTPQGDTDYLKNYFDYAYITGTSITPKATNHLLLDGFKDIDPTKVSHMMGFVKDGFFAGLSKAIFVYSFDCIYNSGFSGGWYDYTRGDATAGNISISFASTTDWNAATNSNRLAFKLANDGLHVGVYAAKSSYSDGGLYVYICLSVLRT